MEQEALSLDVGMTLTEAVEIEIKREAETMAMGTMLATPLVARTMSPRTKIRRSKVEVVAAVEMGQEGKLAEWVDPRTLDFIP